MYLILHKHIANTIAELKEFDSFILSKSEYNFCLIPYLVEYF